MQALSGAAANAARFNETTIDLDDVSFCGRLTCLVTPNNCQD